MEFEWDEGKNQSNITKHGVSFVDAKRIFEGFTLDVVDDRFGYGEERVISLGIAGGVVVLVVAHTERQGAIRIISERPAKKSEKERYDEAVRQSLNPGGDRGDPGW